MSRRSRAIAVALVGLLALATPAFAHRLDEVLQATTVRLDRDRVTFALHLTPGTQVYRAVAADIDADRDGAISDAEARAYAERVRQNLAVTVDGTPASLRLLSADVPPIDAMRAGDGDLVLTFDAPVTGGGHRVTFENRNRLGGAPVYLVNCLVPADPDLVVTAQSRSHDQSRYQLDYAGRARAASWVDRTGVRSLVEAYVFHGVRHILTGYDHLLFVSALVLAARTLWDLVKVVTSFTVAHTATLTLAALGWVHLSGRIVEPMIAASIVIVALQNVLWPRQARGPVRLAAAFAFGLFHGLGFAGGLLDAMREMPAGAMALAIGAFSVGVELGHQMVVLPLFAVTRAARSARPEPVARARLAMAIQRFGSAGITAAGGYYLWVALAGAR